MPAAAAAHAGRPAISYDHREFGRHVQAPGAGCRGLRHLYAVSGRHRRQLERRRRTHQRLCGRRDRRPEFLLLLYPGRPGLGPAASRTGAGPRPGQVRRRGLARAQGRHPVLGQRGDRRDPRRRRRTARLRQDHARRDRAPHAGTAAAARQGNDRALQRRAGLAVELPGRGDFADPFLRAGDGRGVAPDRAGQPPGAGHVRRRPRRHARPDHAGMPAGTGLRLLRAALQ